MRDGAERGNTIPSPPRIPKRQFPDEEEIQAEQTKCRLGIACPSNTPPKRSVLTIIPLEKGSAKAVISTRPQAPTVDCDTPPSSLCRARRLPPQHPQTHCRARRVVPPTPPIYSKEVCFHRPACSMSRTASPTTYQVPCVSGMISSRATTEVMQMVFIWFI